jgi:hypothetical protein
MDATVQINTLLQKIYNKLTLVERRLIRIEERLENLGADGG